MKAAVFMVVLGISTLFALNPPSSRKESSKIEKGLQISPVAVKPTAANKSIVGWGSYIVNAASGCANCHTCPTFVPGTDKGKGKQVNAENYMAGGVPFTLPADSQGPSQPELKSANLTPDTHGLPGGLTFVQFKAALTEGHRTLSDAYTENPAPSEAYTGPISVMPWRIYQNFAQDDLVAIYEYLKAIPSAKAGSCTGPGQ